MTSRSHRRGGRSHRGGRSDRVVLRRILAARHGSPRAETECHAHTPARFSSSYRGARRVRRVGRRRLDHRRLRVSIALTAAWCLVAAIGCALVARRVRPLRVPVVPGYVIAAGVIGAYLGATTLRDRVVHEEVVTAAPAAADPGGRTDSKPRAVELVRAPFRSYEHATAVTAAVVRLPDGRRFATLTGFSTSPGPDLRVRAGRALSRRRPRPLGPG